MLKIKQEETKTKNKNNKVQHQQSQQQTSEDNRARVIFEKKIESITYDLTPHFKALMHSISEDNAMIICDYIIGQNTEINPSPLYRRGQIQVLAHFSKYHDNTSFRDITYDDIINYLNSLRHPQEKDPLHKWIGTYNLRLVYLLRFFKWLYYPELPPKHRPTPDVMKNIVQLHRKEKSIYKPTDLWSLEDDALFIKYCKSKRDIAYHMLSRDSSCRPGELLNLKISDIHFKQTPDGTKQYAEVLVSGKTGSRYIPLFHSVPYLKDWLDAHPYGKNPNAPLIPSLDVRHKRYGLKMKIPSLFNLYAKYRDEIFPDLLNNPVVPSEDKIKIKNLIHNRKWNPYIRRHTALTEKAKILKEPILKSHSGWSQSSQMHLKYEHWFGNESTNALLEAYGVLTPEDNNPYIDTFKPKACPNCKESNIPDAKFCKSCRMVLTYDAFQDTLEEQKKKDQRVQNLEQKLEVLEQQRKQEARDLKLFIVEQIERAQMKGISPEEHDRLNKKRREKMPEYYRMLDQAEKDGTLAAAEEDLRQAVAASKKAAAAKKKEE